MKKKIVGRKTMGPVSAGVLQSLLQFGKTVFTLDDACGFYGKSRQETSDFLGDLVSRGLLVRIKSGIFLILQIGQEDTQLSNWPLIVRFLVGENDYYISHYSAMRLHGMTTHASTDVIITLHKRLLSKKIHHLFYRFIYIKPENFWGLTDIWVTKQEKISVSDIERTILDGLERPSLCGGILEVVKGIWSKQNQIDWNRLNEYAKKYHSKAAIKRLAYILEILNLGLVCIPVIEKIIASKKDFILFDPDGLKTGKYLSRWRLQLNLNVAEIKSSVWG